MRGTNYTDDLPHLRRNERIGAGLRRVVQECCEQAVQHGVRTPTDDAVHEARRALKRARAALRIGEELGVRRAKPLRKRLSAIARELSPRRDAAIVGKMAERLAEKLHEAKPATVERAGRPEVKLKRDAAAWAGWQRRLFAEIGRAGRATWGDPSVDDVRRALHGSAQRVCRRAKKADAKGDIASAHEWRKAVIVLREQMLVVRILLTEKEAAACEKLHALAQQLGKATDYNVLKQAMGRGAGGSGAGRGNPARFQKAAKKRRARALRKARKCWPRVRRMLRKRF